MTAVDLDALDKLRGAATRGPWEVRWQCPAGKHHHDWDEGWVADPEGATVAVVAERYTSATEDGALIVAVVNALPDLIAEARKYRALRETVLSLAARADVLGEADFADSLRDALAIADGEQ